MGGGTGRHQKYVMASTTVMVQYCTVLPLTNGCGGQSKMKHRYIVED